MRRRLPLTAAGAAALVCLATVPALAGWALSGAGSTAARAAALAGPTGVAAAPVAPTSSSVDVTWVPGANPSPTTYVVQRDKTATGAPGPVTLSCTSSPCHDTGLTSGVTYTYTVSAALGGWRRTSATTATATTTAALVVVSATANGSGKTRFSGTGAVAGIPLTVALCRTAVLTCTTLSPGYVETVSVTPTTAGAWTTGPTASKLVTGSAYWATAAQGLAVSAVFTFTA